MVTEKFPEKIYQTPDGWGETTVADEERMGETIDAMLNLGDDWGEISIYDCVEHTFVRDLGDGKALYEGPWYRYSWRATGYYNATVFARKNEVGFFEKVEVYDSVEDFDHWN